MRAFELYKAFDNGQYSEYNDENFLKGKKRGKQNIYKGDITV